MKHIVLLCDGMSEELVNDMPTPMELAHKPNMSRLAKDAEIGLCHTVPQGMSPGSDIANLSVLGYDPAEYYTGRSPLEAVSMGISLKDGDLALRCNLVSLSDADSYDKRTMLDYSGGDISTEDAAELIAAVNDHLKNSEFEFFSGVSYRHCLLWHGAPEKEALDKLTPPHDISGRVIGEYLSQNETAQPLLDMMKQSPAFLQNHPTNARRVAAGHSPANSIWLWGQGTRPALPAFKDLYGKTGAVVSAVDLLRGIAICAGLNAPAIPGATGYIDTNFEGKTQAALDELKHNDFVYIHVEAPDECGHRGERDLKKKAIELIDERVLGPLLKGLKDMHEDYRIAILPDHPTPLCTKTHSSAPVPYLLYQSNRALGSGGIFTETGATQAGNLIAQGHTLMSRLINE